MFSRLKEETMISEKSADAQGQAEIGGLIWHCHCCGLRNNQSSSSTTPLKCKVCGRSADFSMLEHNPFHGSRLDSFNPFQIKKLVIGKEEYREGMDAQYIRPLHLAAASGDPVATKAILEGKPIVHACALFGWQSIHLAAHAGDVETVRLLLDAGADKDALTKGELMSPLIIAAKAGNAGVCNVLMNDQANYQLQDKACRTAFHYAATGGHVEVSIVLLQHLQQKARMDVIGWIQHPDIDGFSAKQHADLQGHNDFVKLCLAAERNVSEVVDLLKEKYHTPIWLEAKRGLAKLKEGDEDKERKTSSQKQRQK